MEANSNNTSAIAEYIEQIDNIWVKKIVANVMNEGTTHPGTQTSFSQLPYTEVKPEASSFSQLPFIEVKPEASSFAQAPYTEVTSFTQTFTEPSSFSQVQSRPSSFVQLL
jgi:hypothetical protein